MLDWLTDDQRALRDMAEKFARREVEPIANQIDLDESIPDSLVAKAAELGLYGLMIPPEYGGSGADLVSACLVAEEIAKASPAYAGMMIVQMILCAKTIEYVGTDEQKQRILPRLASGERLMAYSQSEHVGAGNVGQHLTKLVPDGNGYRLNGAKLFCTQGSAKTYIVFGKTVDGEGNEGYGSFLVEREDEGFEVAPYEDKLGWRGTNTGPISFTDVRVEADDILGGLLTGGLDERPASHANVIAHAVTSLGCAQGMFDKTLAYVRERDLYGKNMAELQPVSYWLAESFAKIQAMRALVYDTARTFDDGTLRLGMPALCKAWVGETAFEVCSRLLNLWGGSGIMNSTGINRYMRDAKAKCVAEGTSEMHYTMVANTLLHGQSSLLVQK